MLTGILVWIAIIIVIFALTFEDVRISEIWRDVKWLKKEIEMLRKERDAHDES